MISARRLWNRLRPRGRIVLEPRARRGVEILEAGRFRSLDGDPQLDLIPRSRSLPRGRCRLELNIEGRGCALAPLLFYDRGQGFEAAGRIPLPPASARLLVTLPAGIRALRLDPLEAPGDFSLGPLVFDELPSRRRVLFIEDRVPYEKLGAGYPRARRILRGLTELGWRVAFYSMRGDEDWAAALKELGEEVEPLIAWGEGRLAEFLRSRRDSFRAVLVSRPHNMALLRPHLGGYEGRLIYDAEALYADRLIARRALIGDPMPEPEARALAAEELALVEGANRVLCVSPGEAKRFAESGARVEVLSHACPVRATPAAFEERAGFLFVGALRDEASPNVEGLRWFLDDIWPGLHRATAATLTIAGGGGERFSGLPGVEALGFVEDLEPLYSAARVFVAPTRYAAGIPLKLIEAAARGLPSVATSLLAEQLGWDEEIVSVAPDALGEACLRLYRDAELWRRCREAGLRRVGEEHGAAGMKAVLGRVLG